jgi:hypothetical protein
LWASVHFVCVSVLTSEQPSASFNSTNGKETAMTNIETKVGEGFDAEGRVIISCEVWEIDGTENYAEVVYSSYMDEYNVVFGFATVNMYETAVKAIREFQAGE